MAIALKDSQAQQGHGRQVVASFDKVKTGNVLTVAIVTNGAGGGVDGPKYWQRLPTQKMDSNQGELRLHVFIRAKAPGGNHQPKFTWSGACNFAYVASEWSGTAQSDWSSSLDSWKFVAGHGHSTNPNTVGSAVTTTFNNEMFVGFIAARHNNLIPNTDGAAALTGWTRDHNPHSHGANTAHKVSLAQFSLLQATSGQAPDLSKTISVPTNESRQWIALVLAIIPSGSLTAIKGSAVSFRPEMTLAATAAGGTIIQSPPGGGPAPSTVLVQSPVSQGRLWRTGGTGNTAKALYHSTDGTSWTLMSAYTPLNNIVAAAGSPTKVWVWEHSPNFQRLVKVDTQAAVVYSRTHPEPPPLGMVVLDKFLYRWTGSELYEYDTTVPDHSLPFGAQAAGKLVHNTGTTVVGATGGICATDTAVVYFVASEGQTTVYSFEKQLQDTGSGVQLVGAGSVLWELPPGFTAAAICHSQGTVYLLGDYLGKLVLWGLPPGGTPVFFGYVRTDLTLTARSLGAGFGNTLLLGALDSTYNYMFVYDAGANSFSLLGRFTRATNGDLDTLATFKGLRLAALSSSTTVKSGSFTDDYHSDTSTTAVLVSGAWDYDLPEQDKILHGFNVLHSPGDASKSFRVDYCMNETLDAGALDFTRGTTQTPDEGVESTYIELATASATLTFRQLRWLLNSSGLDIYSVSALATLAGFYETWTLALYIKDMSNQTRFSGSAPTAEKQRDNLITARRAETVVEFVNGYAHKNPSDAETSDVLIATAEDVIGRNHEGVMHVVLRAVTL